MNKIREVTLRGNIHWFIKILNSSLIDGFKPNDPDGFYIVIKSYKEGDTVYNYLTSALPIKGFDHIVDAKPVQLNDEQVTDIADLIRSGDITIAKNSESAKHDKVDFR